MGEAYDQVAIVLTDVCRESALAARQRHKPELSIQEDDYDLVRTYIDHGIMKIATRIGVIRGEYGGNSPQDNLDPADTTDPLVPGHLIRALSYWTLSQWYFHVDPQLASDCLTLMEKELDDHRFHPGTDSIIKRPYSAL